MEGQVALSGQRDSMTNRVKVSRVKGLSRETGNFSFKVKVMTGLEITCPNG